MPRGDGTGPAGMGPMTGRAAGYCAGYATPGFTNPVPGGGFGLGRGRGGIGRGLGLGFRGGRGGGGRRAAYAPPRLPSRRSPLCRPGSLRGTAHGPAGTRRPEEPSRIPRRIPERCSETHRRTRKQHRRLAVAQTAAMPRLCARRPRRQTARRGNLERGRPREPIPERRHGSRTRHTTHDTLHAKRYSSSHSSSLCSSG